MKYINAFCWTKELFLISNKNCTVNSYDCILHRNFNFWTIWKVVNIPIFLWLKFDNGCISLFDSKHGSMNKTQVNFPAHFDSNSSTWFIWLWYTELILVTSMRRLEWFTNECLAFELWCSWIVFPLSSFHLWTPFCWPSSRFAFPANETK